jgi:hypothetical protein
LIFQEKQKQKFPHILTFRFKELSQCLCKKKKKKEEEEEEEEEGSL